MSSGANASMISTLRQRSLEPAVAFGFVLGFLVRWTFYILMLAGCVGLLLSLPGARRLVIVNAYAWIALTILEIVILLYGINAAQNTQTARGTQPWLLNMPSSGELIFMFAIACAVGIAFPFTTLAILRRPSAVAYFQSRRRTSAALPPLPLSRIERYAAWTVLIVIGVVALHELAQLLLWLTYDQRRPSGFATYDSIAYAFGGVPGTITPLILLHVATRAAMITAAIMTLRRAAAARTLMIIACLASIILETARLSIFATPAPYRTTAGGPSVGILEWFTMQIRTIAPALRTAFAYALLILTFLNPTPALDQDDEPADAQIIP
jgi:hypothetical protein